MELLMFRKDKKEPLNFKFDSFIKKIDSILTNKKSVNKESIIDLFKDPENRYIGPEAQLVFLQVERLINSQNEELKRLKEQSDALETFLRLMNDPDRPEFYHEFLISITHQLKSHQSVLFLSSDDAFLRVEETYACVIENETIEIGEGLVGQCFKQQKTILVNIPDHQFFGVESGLGNAKRNSLLLLPVVYGSECLGVLEFASLQSFPKDAIQFAEKVAGYLGAVCFNHRSSRQTRKLLQTLEERNQEMYEKEEELRQNFEELSASQEEMLQKQIIIDQQSGLMKMIVDYIPFPVFVKDEEGRYTLINKAEAELLGKPEDEIIGFSDHAFVQHESEWEVIQDSDRRVLESTVPIELDEQEFTTPCGKQYLFKTTKVPFVNNTTGKKNILGVSIDLTTFKMRVKSEVEG